MQQDAPEFSRKVDVSPVDRRGASMRFEATGPELAALQERFDLLALDALAADVRIVRDAAGNVRVNVEFTADVIQSCVVSLEPVSCHIVESFEAVYGDTAVEDEGELTDPEGPDPIEPLEGDEIDIGELVAQYLSLSIDPYPRSQVSGPGADGAAMAGDDEGRGDGPASSPFRILAQLRK